MPVKDPKASCPVEGCGSRSFHFRYKTGEIVCHKCGIISPWGDREEKVSKTREKILSVMQAAEKGMPKGVGAWSISYKKANAACRYMGSVDDEICKLQDEGLVTEWSPYGLIYYIGDHPLVCPPWREKEIAEALKEGKDIRVTKESMERDEKELEERERGAHGKKIDPRAT
jgi:hypothetical protein